MGLLIGNKMWILSQIKVWGYAIVGAILAVLGVASVYFKNKAERIERERDTLSATVHAVRIRKRIEKEEEKRLSERVIKKEKEIKEKGYDKDLGSNDNW